MTKARAIRATPLVTFVLAGLLAAAAFEASAAEPEEQDGWQYERGSWYYYIDSVRQTGWIQVGKNDYYLAPNGKMATGWVTWNNAKYYMDSEGVMVTGWFMLGNKWHYFHPDGTMAIGWIQDGKTKDWYFMGRDGAMTTGWVTSGNNRYYMDSGGAMVTDWLMLGNKWHYFHPDGTMATGWLSYKNKWYYMNRDGTMVSSQWLRIDNVWYHFSAIGTLYSATGDGSSRLSASQAAFVDRYLGLATALSVRYGIPWEAVMAQGILESASGTSNFARNRNNFFGIGAGDSNPGNARYYESPEAGWVGYYDFIRDNTRYARHGVFREPNVTDPYAYIRAVKAAGYATDPNYVAKLTHLVTAVINRAYKMGWQTSVALEAGDPQMMQAAARNARR